MKVFIYLFIYLFVISCSKRNILYREGLEGYIYNNNGEPIDSASIIFIDNFDLPYSLDEKETISDSKGFFAIPSVLKKLNYTPNPHEKLKYPHYLKIEKLGYIIDTIYIGDKTFRRNKEKHMVYIDTIFLKPIK